MSDDKESKKVNHVKQWLQVLFMPLFVMLIITSLSEGFFAFGLLFFLPLGAISGVHIGLTTSAPFFYGYQFNVIFALLLSVTLLFMIVGIRNRKKLWGKCLFSFGFYLWGMAGLMALSMSY